MDFSRLIIYIYIYAYSCPNLCLQLEENKQISCQLMHSLQVIKIYYVIYRIFNKNNFRTLKLSSKRAFVGMAVIFFCLHKPKKNPSGGPNWSTCTTKSQALTAKVKMERIYKTYSNYNIDNFGIYSIIVVLLFFMYGKIVKC